MGWLSILRKTFITSFILIFSSVACSTTETTTEPASVVQEKIKEIPNKLEKYNLTLGENQMSVDYIYNVKEKQTGITNLLQDLKDSGLKLGDLKTEQNTLEKIFVNLVRENNEI